MAAGPAGILRPRELTRAAFAPFGDVIATQDARHFPINDGTTTRFHDLAQLSAAGPGARMLVSVFRARPFALPVAIATMERHPLGSQAFVALHRNPWLVVVARDEGGTPGEPQLFVLDAGTAVLGVNYAANVWHHRLIALQAESDFLVIDRGGDGPNLEERAYARPYVVETLERA